MLSALSAHGRVSLPSFDQVSGSIEQFGRSATCGKASHVRCSPKADIAALQHVVIDARWCLKAPRAAALPAAAFVSTLR